MLDSLAAVGRGVDRRVSVCRLAGAVRAVGLSHLLRPPFYGAAFWRALVEIGYFSLPVVALTAVFTGMVLALQSLYRLRALLRRERDRQRRRDLDHPRTRAGAGRLMVAGRIGAAMAAEIGTMRVTDQIDALSTLVDQSDEVPGRTAPAGRHYRAAAAGGGRRHPRA